MEMKDSVCPSGRTDFLPSQDTTEESVSAKESISQRRLRYAVITGIILGTTLGPQNDGICSTWPNVFASDMETDRSTIYNTSLEVTDWQLDFMSSSFFIGSLPVIVVSGMLVSWLGRRKCMTICSIPGAIGWILIALGYNVPMVLVGRFLCGAAHGLQGIAVRSYLAEISDAKFRGAAGMTTETMKGLGFILIIALGIFMPWYYTAIFCACHILLFGMVFAPIIPRSPSHLIVKGKEEEAIKILRKLRGPDVNHTEMVRQLKKENEKAVGVAFRKVFFKPDMFKRYLIVAGLFFIGNFSGVEVVRGNATRMLQTSGLAFDKDVTTMIVFCVLLAGSISQILVLDWIGRRRCLVASLVLLVIGYAFLGTYVFLNTEEAEMDAYNLMQNFTISDGSSSKAGSEWSWVPSLMLMTVAFGSSLGIGSLPWLLSTEYFPTTIRPQVLSICSITANMTSIAALQLYSPLQTLLTPAGLYWFYGSFSALGIVYTLVFVYETKGISIG
ncbi:facilitated trehalose transporter Tret1-like [Macrobrachium rosenbergii]|uniref:facilitated trehalose transporter Tret1-like n=1 Tax=Macrobrachium rosenbergii TaxID=79674 RepID=UPI0034D5743E